MITSKEILSRLTDVFNKNPESNIGKLCSIMAEQLRKVQQTNDRVREWREIDRSQGRTLDMIGSNIGQPRGAATDEVYRIMIKSKVARNLSTADINTIIRVLAIALDADYSEIKIEEMYDDQNSPEPSAIKVIQVPLASLNAAGMTVSQFGRIVKRTVAAGVRVQSVAVEGTFEYGPLPMQNDMTIGFSDIDSESGGTLGAVYDPGADVDLPI